MPHLHLADVALHPKRYCMMCFVRQPSSSRHQHMHFNSCTTFQLFKVAVLLGAVHICACECVPAQILHTVYAACLLLVGWGSPPCGLSSAARLHGCRRTHSIDSQMLGRALRNRKHAFCDPQCCQAHASKSRKQEVSQSHASTTPMARPVLSSWRRCAGQSACATVRRYASDSHHL
jgi:hypothetical protein